MPTRDNLNRDGEGTFDADSGPLAPDEAGRALLLGIEAAVCAATDQ